MATAISDSVTFDMPLLAAGAAAIYLVNNKLKTKNGLKITLISDVTGCAFSLLRSLMIFSISGRKVEVGRVAFHFGAEAVTPCVEPCLAAWSAT